MLEMVFKAQKYIKSLKACARHADCMECEYRGVDHCKDALNAKTVALIEELAKAYKDAVHLYRVMWWERLRMYHDMRSLASEAGGAECAYCVHNKDADDAKCARFDYDCEACDSSDCMCATCGNGGESKFEYQQRYYCNRGKYYE